MPPHLIDLNLDTELFHQEFSHTRTYCSFHVLYFEAI